MSLQPPDTDDLRAAALYCAAECIDTAVRWLRTARHHYAESALPADVKAARLAALDAKIAALQGVHADPNARPWIGDFSC